MNILKLYYYKLLKFFHLDKNRATRRDYRMSCLKSFLVGFLLFVVMFVVGFLNLPDIIGAILYLVSVLYLFYFIYICIAILIKRLHDLGHSGWRVLLYIFVDSGCRGVVVDGKITDDVVAWCCFVIGFIMWIYISFVKGEEKDNKYGPNPYKKEGVENIKEKKED